jgi:hypothetical protein
MSKSCPDTFIMNNGGLLALDLMNRTPGLEKEVDGALA